MPERLPAIRATVMPTDLNPYGGAFGGWIISQMALGAASLAARRCGGKAILIAADDIRFPAGLLSGDELSVFVKLLDVGRSSMTILAEAERRERHGETCRPAASGRFTFVAVDENDRPRPIVPSTTED